MATNHNRYNDNNTENSSVPMQLSHDEDNHNSSTEDYLSSIYKSTIINTANATGIWKILRQHANYLPHLLEGELNPSIQYTTIQEFLDNLEILDHKKELLYQQISDSAKVRVKVKVKPITHKEKIHPKNNQNGHQDCSFLELKAKFLWDQLSMESFHEHYDGIFDRWIGRLREYINSISASKLPIEWRVVHVAPTFLPCCYQSAVVCNRRIWVFGGEDFHWNPLNNLNCFDIDQFRWFSIHNTQDESLGYPKRRISHTLCVYKNNLVLFGGRDADENYLNDLWLFNIELKVWHQIEADFAPTPRLGHSASMHNDQMIVFGGTDDNSSSADLNIFCFQRNVWFSNVQTGGSKPLPRNDHISLVVSDKMYVFGGESSGGVKLDDFYSLDLGSMIWTCISTTTAPPPRFNHAGCTIGRYILLMGGWKDDDTFRNDLWLFDTENEYWEEIIARKNPIQRYGHSLVSFGSSAFLLTGYGQTGEYLNDVHLLQTYLPFTISSFKSDLNSLWNEDNK
eukprot:gb/GECH01000340.1/.p1 GENE.gb/GECH01000340.1/~~gb/GECH01000340.1/.p1  ORF type:complete len:510 (+),score=58.89 gb/GECH01000340.1/:1-1530(+)